MVVVRRHNTRDDRAAIVGGAAFVGNRRRRRAAGLAGLLERRGIELRSDQRIGSRRHRDHGRRHGCNRDARGGAGAACVERHADTDARYRDVHFGARNEAQVGVGGALRRALELDAEQKFAGLERVLADADDERFDRHLALPAFGCDHANAGVGDQRRNRVAGRRRVAEIAAERCATLYLGRSDQVDRFDQAGKAARPAASTTVSTAPGMAAPM